MASVLKVDDLRGNTASGNITITSEGGAATMQLQQGVAKAWMNFNGRNTSTILDSFNYSSMVDNGVGDYTLTVTNAMNNSNYSHSGTAGWSVETLINISPAHNSTAVTTTVTRYAVTYQNSFSFDSNKISTSLHGDLA
tara:strand:- start:792 stop:1205 length:414 start_codon:yes stop_codon:yes gene_type:complete